MFGFRNPAVVMLLGVTAAGCASRADVETMGDALRADIRSIEEGQQRFLAQLRGGLDSLEASGDRRESTGRGEFERRVRQLEGLVEQLMDIATQNNQLLNDLYQNQRSSAARPRTDPPTDTGGASPLGSDEPTQFYGLALDMYNRGNFETARDAFRSFLAENAEHELAPDAQYYVARTYEEGGDVGDALEEFRRVSELYPDSNRAGAALYRRGLLETDRGNTAIARRLFTQVVTGYPNSPEATLARRELDRLGG